MNVLSLFDGMSCGRIALDRLGIKYNNYFACEIDKHAIKVAQYNYPDTIQLGDITQIDFTKLPKIDLLIGGSPCQGFSFSGKQLAFDDPRSKLFFEYVRALKETNPKYFLLENVKMKKEYENIITDMLGVNPIEINSSLVSAQNRRRLYWTNIPNITQPEDKKIMFKDIMEHNAQNVYRVTEKMMNWINKCEKRRKRLKVYNEDSDCKMQMLEASHHKGISNQRCFVIEDPQTGRIVGRRLDKNGTRKDYDKTIKIEQTIEINEDVNKTNCLTTVNKDNVIIDSDYSIYRYISVLECERLQTVPENYTSVVSNTQRYKMLGNGWTIDVICHILKSIKEV